MIWLLLTALVVMFLWQEVRLSRLESLWRNNERILDTLGLAKYAAEVARKELKDG